MLKRLMILALMLIILVGMLPVLSAFAAFAIAGALDCRLDEGSIHPCLMFGRDIGDSLYTMLVAGWLGMITIPFAAVALAVWLAVALLVAFLRRRRPSAQKVV